MTKTLKILGTACLLLLSACEDLKKEKLPEEFKESEKIGQTKDLQEKWDKLAAFLKIGNNNAGFSATELDSILNSSDTAQNKMRQINSKKKLVEHLSQPSAHLNPENQDSYKDIVFSLAKKFHGDNFKTQCAAVDKFEKIETGHNAKDFNSYLITFRAQKNFQGEPESKPRHGLVTIPHNKDANTPLLAFAHGDDMGLALGQLIDGLGSLMSQAVVLAPAFPGEPICLDKISTRNPDGSRNLSCNGGKILAQSQHVSKPWDTDSDELLTLLDCANRAFLGTAENLGLVDEAPSLDLPKSPAAIAFHEAIADLTPDMHLQPKALFIGASRGSLVAQMALAKLGAQWSVYGDEFAKSLDKISAYEKAKKILGDKIAFTPSKAYGLASVAGPCTMTIGTLRILLEKMITGRAKLTSGYRLAGLRQIIEQDIFEDYRTQPFSEELLKTTALRVAQTDITFIAPLVLGALKDWSVTSKLIPPGKTLVVASDEDKIVPFEQSRIFYNILYNLSENPVIKAYTKASEAISIKVAVMQPQHYSYPKQFNHIDTAFFESTSKILPGFVTDQSIKAFLSPFILSDKKISLDEKTLAKRKANLELTIDEHLSQQSIDSLFSGKMDVKALNAAQKAKIEQMMTSSKADATLPEILQEWFESASR